jgi:hypothetical protein
MHRCLSRHAISTTLSTKDKTTDTNWFSSYNTSQHAMLHIHTAEEGYIFRICSWFVCNYFQNTTSGSLMLWHRLAYINFFYGSESCNLVSSFQKIIFVWYSFLHKEITVSIMLSWPYRHLYTSLHQLVTFSMNVLTPFKFLPLVITLIFLIQDIPGWPRNFIF